MLLDPHFHRFRDAIEAQIILCCVDFREQGALPLFKLHFIYGAFEQGFLYALACTFAGFGDTPESLAAGGSFG